MENLDKVVGFLRKNKGIRYCDSCISKSTGVTPPNQVNQLARPLKAATSDFERVPQQRCASCGEMRTCTTALKA
jgi:hypothetical protein